MKRGDLVTVAVQGAYGKPRPALVIQSDLFSGHPSVTILPVTNELRNTPLCRIAIEPTSGNGLKHLSHVMIDKAQTIPSEKIGRVFGRLDDAALLTVTRALAVWFGFA